MRDALARLRAALWRIEAATSPASVDANGRGGLVVMLAAARRAWQDAHEATAEVHGAAWALVDEVWTLRAELKRAQAERDALGRHASELTHASAGCACGGGAEWPRGPHAPEAAPAPDFDPSDYERPTPRPRTLREAELHEGHDVECWWCPLCVRAAGVNP